MHLVRPPDENGPHLEALTFQQRWTPTARAQCIIALAVAGFGRGAYYATIDTTQPGLALLAPYAPQWWLGGLWVTFGIACLVSVILRRWKVVLAVSAGLHALWAVSFAVGGFVLDSALWVLAVQFAALAVMSRAAGAMLDKPVTAP